MPPHRHIFTGGSDSVRGFRDGTLGPRDSLGNPYGGDAGIVGAARGHHSARRRSSQSSARLSLFVDAGQSFYLGDTEFRNRRGDRTDYPLRSRRAAQSRPASPCSGCRPWACSVSRTRMPLRYQNETRREFGDELEEFQFSVGTAF